VFHQGHMLEAVSLIMEGAIKLSHRSTTTEVILGMRFAGAILGIESAVSGDSPLFTAIASTRCSLLSMEVTEFCRALTCAPDFSWQIHLAGSRESLSHLQSALALRRFSAPQRLAMVLVSFPEKETGGRDKLSEGP
jgi:CRP-like cAMP-binding protein